MPQCPDYGPIRKSKRAGPRASSSPRRASVLQTVAALVNQCSVRSERLDSLFVPQNPKILQLVHFQSKTVGLKLGPVRIAPIRPFDLR